jgi:hypothetical protein
VSVAQPNQLGALLRCHSLHLLVRGGREVGSLLAEGVRRLPLLTQQLVDNIHVAQHLGAGFAGEHADVALLLTHCGASLLRLVEVVLVPSELRDLRHVPQLDAGSARNLQRVILFSDLFGNREAELFSHLCSTSCVPGASLLDAHVS